MPFASVIISGLIACLTILGLAIVFGGPQSPPPMASVNDPFTNVDFSDLAPLMQYTARDDTQLTYRAYDPAASPTNESVVLIHGSSARSDSLHRLAKSLAQAGHSAYALDIRGHEASGVTGHIAYIGQLEDDLEDFLNAVRPAGNRTLVGFSAGGELALRFAGSERQKMFDHYLLLSPFIHQDAPTYRPGGGGWIATGVPRIIGLAFLNRLGITQFNDLPVLAFALTTEAQKLLTSSYSYALAMNFRPDADYHANIAAVTQPLQVLVGEDDEVFYADQFSTVFEEVRKQVPIIILPKLGHIDMTLKPSAIDAATEAMGSFHVS